MGASPPEGAARSAVLALLGRRAEGATICPSEVARALATAAGHDDWRAEMATVHTAVDALVANGWVRLSWKGVAMHSRTGPYRIARADESTDPLGRGGEC